MVNLRGSRPGLSCAQLSGTAIAPIAASGTTRLVLAIGSNKAELGAA